MKKLILGILLITTLGVSAQTSYKTALGMHVDFGSGLSTLVGFDGKHFFDQHNVGEAQFLFGSSVIVIGAQYEYHGDIQNAAGLKWYAGLGPQVAIATSNGGGADLIFRPLVGLDYKINAVPLNFSFDWRPAFVATHGTAFEAARFGLGFRYAF